MSHEIQPWEQVQNSHTNGFVEHTEVDHGRMLYRQSIEGENAWVGWRPLLEPGARSQMGYVFEDQRLVWTDGEAYHHYGLLDDLNDLGEPPMSGVRLRTYPYYHEGPIVTLIYHTPQMNDKLFPTVKYFQRSLGDQAASTLVGFSHVFPDNTAQKLQCLLSDVDTIAPKLPELNLRTRRM